MNFNDKSANSDKLIKYGFEKSDGKYVYGTFICDNQFKLTVTVYGKDKVSTELYDTAAEDIYTLHLVEDAAGAFVGRVRAEYEKVLKDISDSCFELDVFRSECSRKVISYARDSFGDELEFLWERDKECAVLRRKDNRKWYAVFMIIPANKLGLDGGIRVEIIDVRIAPEELPSTVDGKRFFAGYHMNKKHWLTIVMDGSVPAEEVFKYLNESYNLAKRG